MRFYQFQTPTPSSSTPGSQVNNLTPGSTASPEATGESGSSPLTSKNVVFQMKINTDGTAVAQAVPLHSPTQTFRRSLSKDDHTLSADMQEFIKYFKSKRMAFGYTQDDIGRELSEMNGPSYSQSFISR